MRLFTIALATLSIVFCASASIQAAARVTVRLTIDPSTTESKTHGQEEVLIDLLDNPAARSFASQLPLTLPFKDYAGAEKIATLPTRLSAKGSPAAKEFYDDAPVDFTYFVPWGNLAVFHKGFGGDGQLLALGRIRKGKSLLAKQAQDFTATLELVAR